MTIKIKIAKLQKKIRCKHCGSNKRDVYFTEIEPCRLFPSCGKCLVPELGNKFVRFLISNGAIHNSQNLDINIRDHMLLISTLYEMGENHYKSKGGDDVL